METFYQISMHIRTPHGFETYGKFDLGSNKDEAETIVSLLKGTDEITEHSVLYMDFTAIQNNIPLPVKIMHCTLDDLA